MTLRDKSPSPRRWHYTTNRNHFQRQPSRRAASQFSTPEPGVSQAPQRTRQPRSATCQGCAISPGVCKVGKAHTILRSLDLFPRRKVTGLEVAWRGGSDPHAPRALQLLRKGKACRHTQGEAGRTQLRCYCIAPGEG